ncbi:MAG: response regulator [Methanoregulaceae archaeon]|nr:response regulator [Methanoregulaceae archaeon]
MDNARDEWDAGFVGGPPPGSFCRDEHTHKGLKGDMVEILLVEDNPGDVRLTKEGLKDSRIVNHIHVVGDGVEAMAFLRKEGKYEDAPRPDLILLDLNLPRKDGRELLAEIKGDRDLKRIPVVVLTSSKAEQDVVMAYDLHANCYIRKPINLNEFSTMMQNFEQFWLAMVTLPPD